MAPVTPSESGPAHLGDFPEEGTVKASPVPDDCFYEVVDGQIVELPPMGAYECDVASFLAFMLGQVVNARQLGKVVVETLFRLDRAGKLKRRPDLAFVSAKKWPIRRRAPKTEAWDLIPDLVIEVVSETNSAQEVIQKVVDYLSAGTRLVWVVYPDVKQVHVYTDLTSARILTEPAELDGGDIVPGFRLSLTELFEDADSAELAPAGD